MFVNSFQFRSTFGKISSAYRWSPESRTAKGFSQESFAEACELHRTYVSLLERGRINITVNAARQIARFVEISRSEWLRGLG